MTSIFLADPNIRAEQIEAIRVALPAGWSLTDSPSGAAAILTENVDVDAAMLSAAGTSLRLVARIDTGKAQVAATAVDVVDLPNTALVGVAEHAVLLIMMLSRQIVSVARKTRAQEWLPDRSEPILTDQRKYTYNWIGIDDFGTLYRKTVGIVGLGIIGKAIAERLNAFGMKVLYTQRNQLDPEAEARYGVQWRELDDLLAESDFVSLSHRFQEGPDGNDNHFGARELALMKPTAYLVNTARGRLVDEDALLAALQSGQIAGAGLDVFRYEPLPADHPFFSLPEDKILLTPHVAGAPITEAWVTIAAELVESLERVSGADRV
ncbi:bifunctional glyoxylate/hydroxypyruvate reductase B [bacterium]|nr:bifunctional glyoxylate/hydroxypyruvate reductase B [bacterium]